ncbi:hypothetical protein BD410DRAFT_839627 [Rickenella mellea]|uniref:Uncharacterized protein n=1 Tax=Rickenella mellea TaxID=50990 RepID=A0A4Y7Q6P7_9AGAM|nr:hypothetical protein BD410DRAFT_839627 [Rickenella mellea]
MSESQQMSLFSTGYPTAEEYSRIPDVKNVKGVFADNAAFVDEAREYFSKHNTEKDFVLSAYHKHFDVPADHFLLLERINLPNNDKGEIVRPIPTTTQEEVHAVAWYVDGSQLKPYTFAKGKGVDLTAHTAALEGFVKLVNDAGLANKFSIKLPNVSPREAMAEYVKGTDELVAGPIASKPFDLESKVELHAAQIGGTHAVFKAADKLGGDLPFVNAAFNALEVSEHVSSEAGRTSQASRNPREWHRM